METTGFVDVSATTVTYLRVAGPVPGLTAGTRIPRGESLVARVLDGAATTGTDVGAGGSLSDTFEHENGDVRSYVVVPVLTPSGALVGLLVGLDRAAVEVPETAMPILRGIADGLGAVSPAVPRGDATDADLGPGARPTDGPRSPDGVPAGPPAPAGAVGAPHPTAGAAAPTPPGPEPAGAGPGPTPPVGPAGAGPTGGRAAGEHETEEAGRPADDARDVEHGPPPGPPGTVRPARPGPRPGPPRPGPPPRPTIPTRPSAGTTGAGAPPSPAGRQVDMRLRRTATGWIVEGPGTDVRPVGDLISAMVLADLLAEDLNPPGRPRRADRELGEIEKLRLSVVQLEHALASRVIVEQAIGVLAERNHIRPRDAFERLRRTARGMGRRVHDLARQVVESVGDPRISLPGELGGRAGAGPRPAPPRATPTRH
jgi:hypothetical protein